MLLLLFVVVWEQPDVAVAVAVAAAVLVTAAADVGPNCSLELIE